MIKYSNLFLFFLILLYLYNIIIGYDFIGNSDSLAYHKYSYLIADKFGLQLFNPYLIYNYLTKSGFGFTSLIYIQYLSLLYFIFGNVYSPNINILLSIILFNYSISSFTKLIYDKNNVKLFYLFILIPILFNPIFLKTLFSQRKDIFLLSILIITFFKYNTNGNWKLYFLILTLFRIQYLFLIPLYYILLFIKNNFKLNIITIFLSTIIFINLFIWHFNSFLFDNANLLNSYFKFQNFKPGFSIFFLENQFLRVFYILSIPWPETNLNLFSFLNLIPIAIFFYFFYIILFQSFNKIVPKQFFFVLSLFFIIYFQFSVSVFFKLYYTIEPRYVLPLYFLTLLVIFNIKQTSECFSKEIM